MERLCALAVGIPFSGRAFSRLACRLYRDGHLWRTVHLLPCQVVAGRRRTKCAAQRWVRTGGGFLRTSPSEAPDPYVWYGWQAGPLPGGGCNGLDLPHGAAGHFRCRLEVRITRSLLQEPPLRWCLKLGVPAPRGIIPGQRLVPPAGWSAVSPPAMPMCIKRSNDGRFFIVHAALGELFAHAL
jgi:hypothetical protein